jgi:hypothetical protein
MNRGTVTKNQTFKLKINNAPNLDILNSLFSELSATGSKPKMSMEKKYNMTRCETCGLQETLSLCGQCMAVKYCSRECQIRDRDAHRLYCIASKNLSDMNKKPIRTNTISSVKDNGSIDTLIETKSLSTTGFATLIHSRKHSPENE